MRITNNPNENPNITNLVMAILITFIIVYVIFKTDASHIILKMLGFPL